ncbi:MAG: hypothetical protein IKQ91_03325, partial [Oscillospiraceae bacterium]|nr:hypothetical protein [Oscillospiraceae bacterium]
YIDTCYFGLADGTHLAIDQHPANKYDENGAIIHIPVRQRPWYRKAVETGTICFSDVMYYDLYTGKPCVTCSAPVYANGKLIGVIGIDLFLTAMEEYVEESAKSGGFICIINNQGKVIFAPDANPLFTVAFSEDDADLRQSDKTDGHYSDLDSVPWPFLCTDGCTQNHPADRIYD